MYLNACLGIICYFLLFSGFVQAQPFTLSGRVLIQPGQNIPEEPIRLLGETDSTQTDEAGEFQLTVQAGKQRITIDDPLSIPLKLSLKIRGDTTIEIPLYRWILSLDSVSIQAYQPAIQTELGKNSLSVQEMKKLPALLGEFDPIKTLSLLPGVQQGIEGSGSLIVRGGTPDQLGILYDGITLYNPYHLGGISSSLPPGAISSVDLYKGNLPAAFGNRLSGILDFQPVDSAAEPDRVASIGLLASSFSLVGKTGKSKKGSYFASARSSYLTLFALPLWLNYRQPGPFSKNYFNYWLYDLAAGYSVSLHEKHSLRLTTFHSRDFFSVGEGIFEQEESKFTTQWANTGVSMTHDWTLSQAWKLSQQLTYSRYGFQTTGESIERSPIDSTQVLQAENGGGFGLNHPAYRIAVDGILSPQLRLAVGSSAEGFLSSFANQSAFSSENSLEQRSVLWAGWTELHFHRPPFSAKLGLRASHFWAQDSNFSRLQPRLSFALALPRAWSLQLGYSDQNQFIQQVSATGLNLPNESWLLSSAALPPGSAQQYAIGIQSPASGNNWFVQLEGYYKTSQNLIFYRPEFIDIEFPTQAGNRLFREGEGEVMGLEALFQAGFGSWRGWMSYTLSRSLQRFPGLRNGEWLPALTDRRHLFNLVLVRKMRLKWEFSANWVFQTGRPVFIPLGIFEDPSGRDRFIYPEIPDRFPAYHRLDVNWTYHANPQKKNDPVWKIGIYNAYNRQNPFFLDVRRPGRRVSNGVVTLRPGRIEGVNIFPFLPYLAYSWKL